MDLFSYDFADNEGKTTAARQQMTLPLAARMRPKTLDDFVGQSHILGPGSLLRRAIIADQITSLLFYGPPGTGKTTIARVIANSTKAHFSSLNAVTAGVADIRRVVEEAKERVRLYKQKTTLFVDEIHRFNKAQQDALLPYVEEGTIILIGATTENPYFEVNKALLSRSHIFALQPLTIDDMREILFRALYNKEVGYGEIQVEITEDAISHLIEYADGDARRLLNALELAVTTTRPNEQNIVNIDLPVAVESIQRKAIRYDKSGDQHYDTISAFIKSIRGSDPDAAVYWLARMLEAGEDPVFIARRIIIAASEDIGNADPLALQIAVAAFQAVHLIGMPEARIPLAQAVTYLAAAPKSNAAYVAINQAIETVQHGGSQPVPVHLRDAHYSGASALGSGVGYLYPHNYPQHYVEQHYFPEGIHYSFYKPTEQGYEKNMKDYLMRINRRT